MIDAVKTKLLILLNKNGSITELIKDGYTYGQIANMINTLNKEKYITEKEGKLVLSDKAIEFINKYQSENKLVGSKKWILPEEKSRSEKLDKNDIYLPSRSELHF